MVTLCATCGDAASLMLDSRGRPACIAHGSLDQRPGAPVDATPFSPEAVDTYVRVQEEAARRDRAGAIRVNVVGVDESGKRPRGALPWHWCYGKQPIFVHGAVYGGTDEARHLVRGITEAEAERRSMELCLQSVSREQVAQATGLSERQLKRRRVGRRKRS